MRAYVLPEAGQHDRRPCAASALAAVARRHVGAPRENVSGHVPRGDHHRPGSTRLARSSAAEYLRIGHAGLAGRIAGLNTHVLPHQRSHLLFPALHVGGAPL